VVRREGKTQDEDLTKIVRARFNQSADLSTYPRKIFVRTTRATALVAELGAAFLCADLGIEGEAREDHAAYLGSWLKVLKEDKRAIFQAAAHAQRAADFLNGHQERPAL
jgi:antirestriction protein ArdC